MNWVIENWKSIGIAAVAALFLWWLIRRISRAFQDRCPLCGSMRQKTDYFLRKNDHPPLYHGIGRILSGVYYTTYKFLTCRGCDHVRQHSRDRFVSTTALWLKRHFKPWQFRRTERINELMRETGIMAPSRLTPSRRCTLRIKLPDIPVPPSSRRSN